MKLNVSTFDLKKGAVADI